VTSVSVVIAARDEPTLPRTVESICLELPADGEIVIVDDQSRDPSIPEKAGRVDPRVRVKRSESRVGVARARNLGAKLATGNFLVIADAHVRVATGWTKLLEALADPAVGAVGPTLVEGTSTSTGRGLRFCDVEMNTEWMEERGHVPYRVPLLPGFFLATRRQIFVDISGFDAGLVAYGMEDVEICMHLVTLGYDCLLVPNVEVVHDPPRGARSECRFDWASVLRNILRIGHVHFGARRLEELHDALRSHTLFSSALAAVHADDSERRRMAIQTARRFDDDWFFAFCGLA
jgi:GT2 family glycosyltransferase